MQDVKELQLLTGPILVDTTLRDGEQAPGVAFTAGQKLEIAKALCSIGIREIEAGTPVMGGEEAEAISAIISEGLPARILTWNRVIEKDIEASLKCGARSLYISAPVSDIQIARKLGKTRDWVIDRFRHFVPALKREGCYVACGLEDASRADRAFLLDICVLLEGLSVNRIRVCDTVGVLSPFKTYDLVTSIKRPIGTPLEIHCHNDFGLATANTLAGITAGAEYASVTVNGIGERAGNASIEEVAMILERLEGIGTGIDTKGFKGLSQLVSTLSGRPVPLNKPIVGDMVFTHESGIHVNGVLKDPSTYEPFEPAFVGGKRKIAIGKHSGRKALLSLCPDIIHQPQFMPKS